MFDIINFKNSDESFKNLEAFNLNEEEIETSKYEVDYTIDKLKLLHYTNDNIKSKTPTLIIYSLINTLDILDLTQKVSLIKGLIDNGLDLYAIEWGNYTKDDRYLSIDDYVNFYINECVKFIKNKSGCEKVNIVLVCQGGILGFIYSALYPENINSICTLATPLNFEEAGNIINIIKSSNIRLLSSAFELIPTQLISAMYLFVYPIDLTIGTTTEYIEKLTETKDKDEIEHFYRLKRWKTVGTLIPVTVWQECSEEILIGNKLFKGTLKIGNEIVNLKNIKVPLLNIIGLQDRIALPETSRCIKDAIGSKKYKLIEYDKDHIPLLTTEDTKNKVAKDIAKFILEN